MPREEWVWEGEHALQDDDTDDDAFEAQYVRQWLNMVVQCACRRDDAAHLVDKAASVLVHLAGQAACGERLCTYYFFLTPHAPRSTDEAAASVCIKDGALTNDALGMRTWGAAPYLTRRLIAQYAQAPCETWPKQILELGAGTGLVGLGLVQWLTAQGAQVEATLTDHHATVLANLCDNARMSDFSSHMHVHRLDWQKVYDQNEQNSYGTLAQTLPHNNDANSAQYGDVPVDAKHDLVVAADCIYDPQHAKWIHAVACRHLARPSHTHPHPQLHLLMPVRATHNAELESVSATFSENSALRIIHTHNMHGYENFGPASVQQSNRARYRRGTPVAYTHFVVEWCA